MYIHRNVIIFCVVIALAIFPLSPAMAAQAGYTLSPRPQESDPGPLWNTFMGGTSQDSPGNITMDSAGNIYVVGSSQDTWGTPISAFSGEWDVFISKTDASGNLLWNTFLGGSSGNDWGNAIAFDENGNIYVSGSSDDGWSCLPVACTIQPFNSSNGSGYNGFLAKLDQDGNLLWNTFLDDGAWGYAEDMTIHGSNIYLVGSSSDTWGNPLSPFSGQWDVFVVKMDLSGNLLWNTFLGGNSDDDNASITIDDDGNLYLAGTSHANWGCSPASCTLRDYTEGEDGNSFDSADGFVAKLDSNGSLLWNTFLGENSQDYVSSIALDGSGNVYAVGGSSHTSWGNPVQPFPGYYDVFAARLNPAGNLVWNTFLGSNAAVDGGGGITVDGDGNIYVSGSSDTSWGTPLRPYSGNDDAFVAKLGTNGVFKVHTFLGQGSIDEGSDMVVDESRKIYLLGSSYDTWGNPVQAFAGSTDVFVSKIDLAQYVIAGNTGVPGAILHYNDNGAQTAIANFRGTYSLAVSSNWTGTVTPSKPGYTFNPPSRAYTNILYNRTKQNYKPTGTFTSIGTQDGGVLESNETSNRGGSFNAQAVTFNLGDDAARRQYRAILSFKTYGNLSQNAIITAVTLKIKKNAIVGGGNLVTAFQGLMVDFDNGIFGTAALQASDFEAQAWKTYGPFSPALVSNWYSINLTSGKAYINNSPEQGGLTQIRLRFQLDDNNNAVANYLNLFSGNAQAANRPQLVITYYEP